MYLSCAAVEATVQALAQTCAPQSMLAMTYSAPPLVPLPIPTLSRIVRASFGALGEPLLGIMTPDAAKRCLEQHGFITQKDSCHQSWAEGRWLDPKLAFPFRSERLLEARLSPRARRAHL